MGLGPSSTVDEAVEALRANFARDDRQVDVVGFSRGAAAALHFVNEVWEKVGKEKADAPRIRFVGLFDAVASTGLLPGPLEINLDLTLPPKVDKCCHAMALDESRASFHLRRVVPRVGALPPSTIEEVWFRGCHSDIGEGHQHERLANIPFVWMLRRAAAMGVQFDAEDVQTAIRTRRADAAVAHASLDKRLGPRTVRPGDHVHGSVSERGQHLNPPTPGCLVVDEHADVRGSYPGEMEWPFDIDWRGALRERTRLQPGGAPQGRRGLTSRPFDGRTASAAEAT